MKYFISQPMNGKLGTVIKLERSRIISAIRKVDKNAEFIESYFEDYDPQGGCIPMKFLAKSIQLLADADIAVFLKDWETTRGCVIEYECAKKYGIPIKLEHEYI